IAEASLQLGLLPGDSKYLTFGRNLLTLTLNRFRPPADKGPRGVAESPVLSPIKLFGPSLWPDPNEYTLRSNVRLYLILKRLNDVLSQSQADPGWQKEILAALQEQSLFLTTLVLPE